jgi:nucleoside-diphosphate-sugar epimerase
MLVILGAGGFVGSSISACLASEFLVKPLKRSDASLNDSSSLRNQLTPGCVVINAAGYAEATDISPSGIARFQQDNVEGVRILAKVCGEVGVGHLIHISSVAAMGPWVGHGISESMMIPPESPYAQSKLDGERVLSQNTYDFPITVLRPTSVFGPSRNLARQLCLLAQSPILSLPNQGKSLIPFTDVQNVVEGVRLSILNQRAFGRTFIVGDQESYRLRDIMDKLSRAFDKSQLRIDLPETLFNILLGGVNFTHRLVKGRNLIDKNRLRVISSSVSYSIESIQADLNYKPKTSIDESLLNLAKNYRSGGKK